MKAIHNTHQGFGKILITDRFCLWKRNCSEDHRGLASIIQGAKFLLRNLKLAQDEEISKRCSNRLLEINCSIKTEQYTRKTDLLVEIASYRRRNNRWHLFVEWCGPSPRQRCSSKHEKKKRSLIDSLAVDVATFVTCCFCNPFSGSWHFRLNSSFIASSAC